MFGDNFNPLNQNYTKKFNFNGISGSKIGELKNIINERKRTENNFYIKRNSASPNEKNRSVIINQKNYSSSSSQYNQNSNKPLHLNEKRNLYENTENSFSKVNNSRENYSTLIVNNLNNVNLNNYSFNGYNNFNTSINQRNLNLNLDYGKSSKSNSSIIIKEGFTPPNLSNNLFTNIPHKEKLIRNLKTSQNDEKLIRNKSSQDKAELIKRSDPNSNSNLNSNANPNSNGNSKARNNSFILKNKFPTPKNISFDNNSILSQNNNTSVGFINSTSYPTNHIQTYKTNNENNSIFDYNIENLNNTQNSITVPTCNCGNNYNNDSTKHVNELENKLDEGLKKIKSSQSSDKNLTYTKKYAIYKKVIEEITKLSPEYTKINSKILFGFNEIFHEMLNENRINNERSIKYDSLSNKYSSLNNKYIENSNILKEKNEKIEILKNKISNFTYKQLKPTSISSKNDLLSPNHQETEEGIKQYENDISDHNSFITNINKKVIEDLDALYFYDKIHMRTNSVTPTNVPKLNLNFNLTSKIKKIDKDNDKDKETNEVEDHKLTTFNPKEILKIKQQSYKILTNNNNEKLTQQINNLSNLNINNQAKSYLNLKDFLITRKNAENKKQG